MKNDKKKRTVQITITEKCNLACVYCYERAKDCGSLSLEKVKSIIAHEFEDDRFDEVEFDFHGGEPALAFDVLKPACEWLWSVPRPKRYICFASTNGTLIHGEIQDWFRANASRFWLGLSLDGTREMHNENRSNSYDQIDFAFFRKMWPSQSVKMTISPQTLSRVCSGVEHIHSLGFKLTANLAHGVAWPRELLPVYRDQLQSLVEFYLANPNFEPVRIVNFNLRKIGMDSIHHELHKENRKWCGTGDQMICYAVNGHTYPCQLFAPSSLSPDVNEVASKWDFSKQENFIDPKCAECCLDGGCPTCYGTNYHETGNLFTRPKSMCDFLKCEAVATSYLYGKMLLETEKYPVVSKLTDADKLAYAKGIEIVQNVLADEVLGF